MAEEEYPLPNNIAFERMILGAALRYPSVLPVLLEKVHADHFYLKDHQRVFEALSAAADQGQVDPILLARSLARSHSLSSDPLVLVKEMYAEATTEAALPRVIEDVVACAHGRRLIQVGRDLILRASQTEGDPDRVAEAFGKTDEEFRKVSDLVVPEGWSSIYDLAKDLDADDSKDEILPTGFIDLDRLLGGGTRPGQLVVIAARPAFGKSTLAMDFSRHASISCNVPGLVVSYEMSGKELATRFMSAEGGVPLTSLRSHEPITEFEQAALEKVLANIEQAPLYIADGIQPTYSVLRNWITAMVQRRGVRYVVVDYVGLMHDPDGSISREQVIGDIAGKLKALAQELGITIFLVAQINRGPESRTDKRPQMSDLRDSGQLENHADIVILIYQEEKYDPTTERAGEADLIVAKHRNGPTDTIVVAFQGHYARFVSLSRADVSPES